MDSTRGSYLKYEVLEAVINAFHAANGNLSEAARTLDVPRKTFEYRLFIAASKGLLGTNPVLPGWMYKKLVAQYDEHGVKKKEWITQAPQPQEQFEIPDGHMVKGISALVDGQGQVINQWIKTKDGFNPEVYVDWLKSAFEGFKSTHRLKTPPKKSNSSLLNLYPCNDWHVGMYTWGEEAEENWDLKISERVIDEGMTALIDRSPHADHAIVLVGGDLIHADNNANTTTRGTVQDVDSRYQKILGVACRLIVRTIDKALAHNKEVIVRVLRGNHDEHAAIAVTYFLLAWYRNEKRVIIDDDPSLFFWFRFGQVLLGATHGHTVKIKDMAGIMAARRAEDWGLTKYRYVHGFHLHHYEKLGTEGNGVVSEIHQAPVPKDAWHFGSGYLSGRSLLAITYHKDFGEISRCREAILDGVGE